MAKRTSSQIPLLNFFSKVRKSEVSSDTEPKYSTDPVASNFSESETLPLKDFDIIDTFEAKSDYENILDLGKYLNTPSEIIDPDTKLKLLSNPWVPEVTFRFPASGKRNLRFQSQWLHKFPWLVYSKKNDGALCKYCVLFSKDTAGKGGHQKLRLLVKEPYRNWKDALEYFKNHQDKCIYHKAAMESGSNFIRVSNNPKHDIRNQVDSARTKQVQENRQILASIVDTIKFCGRQELALRGTNDSGPIKPNDEEPSINDGNFRALLRLRMKCGDQNLIKHTENMSLNATYMSPTIQNELIAICGEVIQKEIVKDIVKAGVFSILVDETADISGNEQLSLCVRYTKKEETCYVTKEDFLGFTQLKGTNAQSIADSIISFLAALGLECKDMVGQGYDGASVMKGSFNGVQALIRKEYPEALYVHCCSHSINLALCHSCNLQSVRNCVGTVKSVISFLKNSPKRMNLLRGKMKTENHDSQLKSLTSMCETRWVENHNSLLKFRELFKTIIATLEDLSSDTDMDTSSKASSFVRALICGEFVVSLCFLAKVFSHTVTLCKVLQSPLCDLKSATDHVGNIVDFFQTMRRNIEMEFSHIYKTAKLLLADIGEEIKLPRVSALQRNRCNIQTSDPEQYFRIAIAIPLLDDFTNQLQVRFIDHQGVFQNLNSVLPSVCCNTSVVLHMEFLKVYKNKVDLDLLEAEFSLWKIYWAKQAEYDRPSNAIEALSECNKEFYPNIFKLLQIFSTLPVTTCTPERTFSTLRRLKRYLRNACGQDRLCGLALMSVHRNTWISTDDVVNIFASKHDRRLNFVM